MLRLRRFSVLLVVVLSLAGCATQSNSGGSYGGYGGIRWTAKVPESRGPLPVLTLQSLDPPADLVARLAAQANGAQLQPLANAPFLRDQGVKVPQEILGVFEDDHATAWVDRRSGNASIYPTLSRLAPLSPNDIARAEEAAASLIRQGELLPADDTRIVSAQPLILNGETVRGKRGDTTIERKSAPYLVYVPARRFVNDLAVYGPGSRAVVIAGANGRIEGLTRQWKGAKISGTVEPTRSADDVRRDIERQLTTNQPAAEIEVQSVEIAYYDNDQASMQPVYRFVARIRPRGGKAATDDDFVIGFVPYGAEREKLPRLDEKPDIQPVEPRTDYQPNGGMASAEGPAEGLDLDPRVGRYVNREDTWAWVTNANEFWTGLQSGFGAAFFSNDQYYWAEQRLFTNQKNFFVNDMNLVLNEVHGDWWLFSTRSNCCDLVNINGDIPDPGYGPSAGGRLADWIIHSCEVIPAPIDTGNWPDPWWRVFGGVRNVAGYRTIMYISDGATQPYGQALANFGPVVSSWLNVVSSLNAYSGRPTGMMHGRVKPLGRASSISACGHDGDSAFAVATLPRANCLTVWWFGDE
jgi:hypothetical protein